MAAVANAGPVAVGVDASSKAFRVKTSPPECQDPSVHIIIPFPPIPIPCSIIPPVFTTCLVVPAPP